MMLFLGGGYFAYKTYKANQPHPIWVPLPINPELEIAKRDEIIKNLHEKLIEKDILLKVSKDLGLPKKLNLESDAECANDLGKRIYVKAGDADTPLGKVPAIHIGVKGKVRETTVTGEIAMRLMDDVWKILGIKPPAKKGS